MSNYKLDDIWHFEFAFDEFYADVNVYDLVSSFMHLYLYLGKSLYNGTVNVDDEDFYVEVNTKENICFINYEPKSITEIISFFNKNLNPIEYAEVVSGLDIADYVSAIEVEKERINLSVKGRKNLRGTWTEVYAFDKPKEIKDKLQIILNKINKRLNDEK